MPGIIVVGLQWGDEGKGKIVDLLAKQASHVVRSQGGNNAGHTIKTKERELALHLIPSGILHSHTHVYIAGGCLVDPKSLIDEIQSLEAEGISLASKLHLSPYAHIIFPFHVLLDKLYEERKGKGSIGTTGRGIGPCLSDRSSRIGLRIADLIHPELFTSKLESLVSMKNVELEKLFDHKPLDFRKIQEEYLAYGGILKPFVSNVEASLRGALIRDETVLFEGAHGILLDGIYGSYPYVTSSTTLPAGVCAGAGIGPRGIDEVLGIVKAYTTRVGEGPFPTELKGSDLEGFRSSGDLREVGVTTGRKRRIGWLDLVLCRFSVEIASVDQLVLTKLDILDQFEEVKVCTGYLLDGEKLDRPPPLAEDLARVEPVYETLEGWKTSTRNARLIRDLPKKARVFIEKVEDFCNVSVGTISVGPGRDETIQIDEEWI